MNARIETLKIKNSKDEEYLVYPRTLIQCVTNEHGANLQELIDNTILNAEGGVYVDYNQTPTTDYVPIDADKFKGHELDYFATAEALSNVVSGETVVAKATDADTLDGFDSIYFASKEELSNASAAANTYTDKALEIAKTYTDTSAASTLASAKEYNDAAYANANAYTDTKIANLINGAPETLDTLKEIADAMNNNADVVEALDEAIGKKANQAELDTHTGNDTIHITADERTAWNKNTTDITNIENGTTTVGNASKLGGKGASEYALASQLTFKSMPTGTDLNDCTEQGLYYFDAHAYNYLNTPNSDAHNGLMTVYNQSADRIEQLYYSINEERMYTRNIIGSATSNWKTIATTADLANYLPKTGGEVITDGNSTYLPQIALILKNGVNSGGSIIRFDDARGFLGFLGFIDTQGPTFSDGNGNPYPLLHSGNVGSYALPISGGTVTSPYGTVMTLRSTSSNEVVMQYRNSADDNEGSLGFNGIDSPIFKKTDGTNLPLLHSGNVGSYTSGRAKRLIGDYGSSVGILATPDTGEISYTFNVDHGTTGLFPNANNANSILTLSRHHGNYASQLGFSSDYNIYHRAYNSTAIDTVTPWKTILDSSNIGNYAATKETGTFTMTYTYTDKSDTSIHTIEKTGYYSKIGNIVYINITLGGVYGNMGSSTSVNPSQYQTGLPYPIVTSKGIAPVLTAYVYNSGSASGPYQQLKAQGSLSNILYSISTDRVVLYSDSISPGASIYLEGYYQTT